ncbi:MAG: hypothetical protein ACYC5Y_05310 [Symbiobacteriia bacterium]
MAYLANPGTGYGGNLRRRTGTPTAGGALRMRPNRNLGGSDSDYGAPTPPAPPAPPKPPVTRPPGRGNLGGSGSDYGAPAAPTAPTVPVYKPNPDTLQSQNQSAGQRLYPGLVPGLQQQPQPLRPGPTRARANLMNQGLSVDQALGAQDAAQAQAALAAKAALQSASVYSQGGHPLGASESDYGSAGTVRGTSPGNTMSSTPTAATVAQTVLRAAGAGAASQPTTTASPTVTQQQQTTGGPVTPTAPSATSSQSQTPAGTDYLSSLHQDLQSELASVQSDSNAAITTKSQYYQQLMDLLEQTKKDLIAQSEADGKQLDPSTLLTLDRLKQDAQDNLKAVREAANRRGILDSGIALGMEQNSQKAYGDQEAQVLSDRLTRIQQGLQDSLRQLSGQAIGVQQAKTADLSSMQDKLFQSLQGARQRVQQRQDSLMQWNAERADNAAARNDQLAMNLSQMSGNVVTPVSQADQLLAQAKRRWNEANARGDQQGMAAAAEMGKQARAMGQTLDPNNSMNYDQLTNAINQGGSAWGQVQQGSQTYQRQQNAQKVLQSAMGTPASQPASEASAPAPDNGTMSRQWDETSYTTVENWIAKARDNGQSDSEIAAALRRSNIDPWDFNLR